METVETLNAQIERLRLELTTKCELAIAFGLFAAIFVHWCEWRPELMPGLVFVLGWLGASVLIGFVRAFRLISRLVDAEALQRGGKSRNLPDWDAIEAELKGKR